MRSTVILTHEFVESFPDQLEDGKLYVSIDFATVAHRCACGCGHQVITPLSPADWQLTFDGESISLWPSIGNWSFDCQSHYWIKNNKVRWAAKWSPEEISAVRHSDRLAQEEYYETEPNEAEVQEPAASVPSRKQGLFERILRWLRLR